MRIRSLFLAMALLGSTAAVSACSDGAATERADGEALKVDVVAPREPDIIPSSGQLSVGDLANSYDHQQTMDRARQSDQPADDIGTSWNDDSWAYSEGTGPATVSKETAPQHDPKAVQKSKSMDGLEG